MLVLHDVASSRNKGKIRDGISMFVLLLCVACILPIYLYGFERCEIIFHSLAETAKQHFPMNSNPIHPQYMYAKCSLLRKPLFRVSLHMFSLGETYIFPQNRVPQHQPSSRRNLVELLSSRTVSHFHERNRNNFFH